MFFWDWIFSVGYILVAFCTFFILLLHDWPLSVEATLLVVGAHFITTMHFHARECCKHILTLVSILTPVQSLFRQSSDKTGCLCREKTQFTLAIIVVAHEVEVV